MLIKPPALKEGDLISLVSPSSGMAGLIPHRVERARAMLEQLGFAVTIGKNALGVRDYVSGTPEERADDMNAAFADPDVKAIISFIGGNHSNQILDLLDYDLIAKNPKIFMGYSDMTVVHFALHTRAKLVSFYGPAALTQFAENPAVLPYTKEYFEKAAMRTQPIGRVEPSPEWTDEILDWFERKDLERPRSMKLNCGYKWLREGNAEGPLMGGCITSMLHLRGTPYWPDFKDAICFWEVPESSADFRKGKSVEEMDASLTDLELSGVFEQIKGMIVGRFFGYTEEQNQHLERVILERVQKYSFPVLTGVDIGHTDPMITVPLGTRAKIDSQANSFEFLEGGLSD